MQGAGRIDGAQRAEEIKFPSLVVASEDSALSSSSLVVQSSFPQFGENRPRAPPHRRHPSEMSEAEAKPEGEEGEEEEMTEEEKLIAAMPHPGREGSSEITAKRLYDHTMSGVEAFEARAGEAERRIALLEDRLRDAQLPGHYERLSMVKNPAPGDSLLKQRVMHQMLDLRKSLGRARVDEMLKRKAAATALDTNARLAAENEKLKYQIAHLTRHVKKSTVRGNWDDNHPSTRVSMVVRDKVDRLVNPPPEPEEGEEEGGDGDQQ